MVQTPLTSVELGRFLKSLRRSARLTQKDAARVLDCSDTLISRFEKGKRTPNPPQLATLARAYGVDRHFVLLRAGVLELPGFEEMLRHSEHREALERALEFASQPGGGGQLLSGATAEERRQVARFLAWLRFPSPVL